MDSESEPLESAQGELSTAEAADEEATEEAIDALNDLKTIDGKAIKSIRRFTISELEALGVLEEVQRGITMWKEASIEKHGSDYCTSDSDADVSYVDSRKKAKEERTSFYGTRRTVALGKSKEETVKDKPESLISQQHEQQQQPLSKEEEAKKAKLSTYSARLKEKIAKIIENSEAKAKTNASSKTKVIIADAGIGKTVQADGKSSPSSTRSVRNHNKNPIANVKKPVRIVEAKVIAKTDDKPSTSKEKEQPKEEEPGPHKSVRTRSKKVTPNLPKLPDKTSAPLVECVAVEQTVSVVSDEETTFHGFASNALEVESPKSTLWRQLETDSDKDVAIIVDTLEEYEKSRTGTNTPANDMAESIATASFEIDGVERSEKASVVKPETISIPAEQEIISIVTVKDDILDEPGSDHYDADETLPLEVDPAVKTPTVPVCSTVFDMLHSEPVDNTASTDCQSNEVLVPAVEKVAEPPTNEKTKRADGLPHRKRKNKQISAKRQAAELMREQKRKLNEMIAAKLQESLKSKKQTTKKRKKPKSTGVVANKSDQIKSVLKRLEKSFSFATTTMTSAGTVAATTTTADSDDGSDSDSDFMEIIRKRKRTEIDALRTSMQMLKPKIARVVKRANPNRGSLDSSSESDEMEMIQKQKRLEIAKLRNSMHHLQPKINNIMKRVAPKRPSQPSKVTVTEMKSKSLKIEVKIEQSMSPKIENVIVPETQPSETVVAVTTVPAVVAVTTVPAVVAPAPAANLSSPKVDKPKIENVAATSVVAVTESMSDATRVPLKSRKLKPQPALRLSKAVRRPPQKSDPTADAEPVTPAVLENSSLTIREEPPQTKIEPTQADTKPLQLPDPVVTECTTVVSASPVPPPSPEDNKSPDVFDDGRCLEDSNDEPPAQQNATPSSTTDVIGDVQQKTTQSIESIETLDQSNVFENISNLIDDIITSEGNNDDSVTVESTAQSLTLLSDRNDPPQQPDDNNTTTGLERRDYIKKPILPPKRRSTVRPVLGIRKALSKSTDDTKVEVLPSDTKPNCEEQAVPVPHSAIAETVKIVETVPTTKPSPRIRRKTQSRLLNNHADASEASPLKGAATLIAAELSTTIKSSSSNSNVSDVPDVNVQNPISNLTEFKQELCIDSTVTAEPPAASKYVGTRTRSKDNATPQPSSSSPAKTSPAKSRIKKSAKVVKSDTPQQNDRPIKCGNCKVDLRLNEWNTHYTLHNGLAWIDNEQEAIDKTNFKTLGNVFNRFMKENHLSSICCDKCGVVSMRSGVGLASHYQKCGLSAEQIKDIMVNCEHCNSKVMPVSLSSHLLNVCPVLKQQKMYQPKEPVISSTSVMYSQTGRIQRKTVSKAQNKIQNIVDMENFDELILVWEPVQVTGGTLKMWSRQIEDAEMLVCNQHNCNYEADDLDTMRDHVKLCFVNSNCVMCTICKHTEKDRDTIIEHIRQTHDDVLKENAKLFCNNSDADSVPDAVQSNSDSDDESSLNTSQKPGATVKPSTGCLERDLFQFEHLEMKKNSQSSNDVFRERVRSIRALHFSTEHLFPHITIAKIVYLEAPHSDDYLQTDSPVSMQFATTHPSRYTTAMTSCDHITSWSTMKVFTGSHTPDSAILFTGNPVLCMDWIPFPDAYTGPQYLVLATRSKTATESTYTGIIAPEKCLIQIWEIGTLDNSTEKLNTDPRLVYTIAYDHGPIWHMRFCPSGGLLSSDDCIGRLGLLAVTASNGHVNIFAVPSLTYRSGDHIPVIRIEPCLILSCDTKIDMVTPPDGHETPVNVHSTQISWTQASGHDVVAAGFSNGAIAVWKLSTKSPLLSVQNANKVRILLPFLIFHPYTVAVTSLSLLYMENTRFLVCGSIDRRTKLFDLTAASMPLEISSFELKSRISCGVWPLNWMAYFVGMDDANFLFRTGMHAFSPLNIGLRTSSLLSFDSAATDIAMNDWLSIVLCSSETGDLYAFYCQNLTFSFIEKRFRDRQKIIGFTQIVSNTDTNNVENSGPNATSESIVFCDLEKPSTTWLTELNVKKLRRASLEQLNSRITRVCCNQNYNAFKYYALGYHAGFVRIRCFPSASSAK